MIGCIVEDRYLVEKELGTGAMGRVYAARHVKVGRRVAIKVMHTELAKNPAIVERFAREAMIAARLRHPNVVSVLDVGTTPDGRPLIVLELAPGIPLSEVAYESIDVVSVIAQLLRGLDHAHRAGLIHRDLKPDNILVETTADGAEIPRIVDFGIAITAERDTTVAGRRLTEANTVIGTPFYMSPEQARGKDVDHRSDLFSLGVIMYELLAGMPPFPGSSVEVALANATREAPTIAERAGVDVDPLLEAFMRRLMARRVDQRFQSARDALGVLELIGRDRIAAARVLGGAVEMFAPVAPEVFQPSHRDARTTVTEPVANPTAEPSVQPVAEPSAEPVAEPVAEPIAEPVAEPVAEDDNFSDLEYSPPTLMRRRRRFAFGIATAAMALLAAAGFAARQPDIAATAPSVDVTISDAQPEPATARFMPAPAAPPTAAPTPAPASAPTPGVKMVAKAKRAHGALAPTVAVAVAPTVAVAVAPTVAVPTRIVATAAPSVATAAPAAPTVAVPTRIVATAVPSVATAAPAAPTVAVATRIVATALPARPAATDDAEQLAAKYAAIAKALKRCAASPETDALWARFRLIRFNDAVANQTSRHEALVALANIESAIR